ncbi:MAG: hypothetical protein F6K42_14945 [Leptolyngbya sp. SIO1D8]|nr:hypothetical protein [Leptolyngbya sp. SIO1D8]
MLLQVSNSASGDLLALFVPITIWGVLMAFFLSLLVTIRDGIQHLKKLHQIPCSRCTYATGSLYLKCTVNPISAFSEAALHCRDYESQTVQGPINIPKPRCKTKRPA